MNKTAEIINKLSEMFNFFNSELESELPEPVITLIPNRGRSSYYGWYWKNTWRAGNDLLAEINIAPDHLERSVDGIAETMIHEMAHLKNSILGIKDCNAAQYHNKKFKVMAEEFGLNVEKIHGRGYASTSLGDKARTMVEKYKKNVLNNENPFNIHRVIKAKSLYKTSKKAVMIEQALIDQVMEIVGDKAGVSVQQALEEYLASNS